MPERTRRVKFDFADSRWLTEVVLAYRQTAYRLEQATIYPSDVHGGAMDAWLAGETTPPPASEWSSMVARHVAEGKRMERVRVFDVPPTPYQEWERWISRRNVLAGEVQRYMDRPVADEIGLTEYGGDWWLLDGRVLVTFHFDGLRQSSVEVTEDLRVVSEAAHWWAVAVANSRAETYGTEDDADA